METEFGGLFLEVGDAAGWSGRGLLEGFHFVVGHAAGDDRVEDAGEFVDGGGEANLKLLRLSQSRASRVLVLKRKMKISPELSASN